MKKIVALVLALMLALSMLTVATAETANPVAGKKVAYIMLLPSATIFQMWKDSCADLCAVADGLEAAIRRDFFKLMGTQSQIAAKAAGRAVDVSADDFNDED